VLLKLQTFDKDAWFSEKWGRELPATNCYKPLDTDSIARLQGLAEMYKDHEGELFTELCAEISLRLQSAQH
jgi:hypothetical protein